MELETVGGWGWGRENSLVPGKRMQKYHKEKQIIIANGMFKNIFLAGVRVEHCKEDSSN